VAAPLESLRRRWAPLWGKTADDLKRQLLATRPEIPPGFDLADFRELLESTRTIAADLDKARAAWLPRVSSRPVVFIGTQGFTLWEARCEVVRRAIEYLENR
jgi:hypothetical protein